MGKSRYDRYDREAIQVLEAARIRAIGVGRDECEPQDLIAALLGDVQAVKEEQLKASAVRIHLSCDLRNILNRAEELSNGLVDESDLVRATVQQCREEFGRYFTQFHKGSPGNEATLKAPANLEEVLGRSIIGQHRAIHTVAEVIRLRSSGLDPRPHRPVAVFLFSGDTGVGKTILATNLAAAWTGRSDRLLRLDCSEYREEHQTARLIGSPPGYVGYEAPSPIKTFLEGGSSGVILFDEFEKANPTLHQMCLGMFDDGRLTLSAGETLDLSGTVMIATTNIRASKERATVGFGGASTNPKEPDIPMEGFKRIFATELLNRFDEIIMFEPLDREAVRRILRDHLVARTNERIADRHGVTIELSERAELLLLDTGYSEEFGARNLQRAFARFVLRPLANLLGMPGCPRGIIKADILNGKITITSANAALDCGDVSNPEAGTGEKTGKTHTVKAS